MKDFTEIQDLVNEKLSDLKFPSHPKGLYDPIEYVLGVGGKRLRPSLCMYICDMFCDDPEAALYPALALELFHNFTLMHDDVMDNADKRRGKPTVHKVWNLNTAILSGDAMLGKSYQVLGKLDPEALAKVLPVFTDTVVGVMEGQQLDMNFEYRSQVSIDEYLEMIRLKTAVLLAGSIKIGALCGGASVGDAEALYNFGLGFGLSFQLKDDYLDVYGDPAVFGKNLGGDIVSNKKTFLYIKALDVAKDRPEGDELRRWFRISEFDKSNKISSVRRIYDSLGMQKIVEDEMQKQVADAFLYLGSSSLSDDKKEVLRSLIGRLVSRDA